MSSKRDGWLTSVSPLLEPVAISQLIESRNGIVMRNFSVNADKLISLANSLGTPLPEYSRLIDGEQVKSGTFINIVKAKPSAEASRTHHRAGALAPHTARSWSRVRPRYFLLLMVEPGWRDLSVGANGESLFVPWRAALDRMAENDASRFEDALTKLKTHSIRFEADRVREPVNDGPILYTLKDADDARDVGARIKQDLRSVLERLQVERSVIDGVTWLQQSAQELAYEKLTILESGDLVVVDNNRWAHGRCAFEVSRGNSLNPREVWSLAVA